MAMQTLAAIEQVKPMSKDFEIRIFAGLREMIGTEKVQVEIEPGTRAGEIKAALARQFPQAAVLIQASRLAVSQSFVADEDTIYLAKNTLSNTLSNTLEIALIPPVSGG